MTTKVIAQQAWYVKSKMMRAKYFHFVRTRIGNRGADPLIPTLHLCERAPSANLKPPAVYRFSVQHWTR
jgi:hypothetical protein